MARAIWKGQLRLSLVSIPVELHSATRSGAHITFRQIHKPSGKPVKYEKMVPGIGPVDADDIVKGYEYEKGHYALIEPEELQAIKLETKKTFELVQFVGYCEIPPLYFAKPYYLSPADELAEQAYQVVRDALRKSEKIGIGQITLRGREHLAAVKPCGNGLLLETLHYADDIRKAEPYFTDAGKEKADAELLDMATTIIDKKTDDFAPQAYQDNYATAVKKLVNDKLKHHDTSQVSEAEENAGSRDNVIDLVAALKKSVQEAGAGKKAAKKAGKKKTSRAKSAKKKSRSSSSTARKKAS